MRSRRLSRRTESRTTTRNPGSRKCASNRGQDAKRKREALDDRAMPGISSGIRLRPASRGDIPAIVAISNSSIDEEENIGFGTPRSELVFSDVERLSAAWQDPNLVGQEAVWMAELDGRIVGCVTVEDRGEALELVNIDVPRELQGRGIGTRIVRLVEERAWRERRRAVTFGTSRNAAGAAWKSLPWWQSRGYRITGEEENDWTRSIGAGVREIRMEKKIPQTTEILLRDVAETDLPIFFEQQRDPAANFMAAFTARDPNDKGAFAALCKEIEEVILELRGPAAN